MLREGWEGVHCKKYETPYQIRKAFEASTGGLVIML